VPLAPTDCTTDWAVPTISGASDTAAVAVIIPRDEGMHTHLLTLFIPWTACRSCTLLLTALVCLSETLPAASLHPPPRPRLLTVLLTAARPAHHPPARTRPDQGKHASTTPCRS